MEPPPPQTRQETPRAGPRLARQELWGPTLRGAGGGGSGGGAVRRRGTSRSGRSLRAPAASFREGPSAGGTGRGPHFVKRLGPSGARPQRAHRARDGAAAGGLRGAEALKRRTPPAAGAGVRSLVTEAVLFSSASPAPQTGGWAWGRPSPPPFRLPQKCVRDLFKTQHGGAGGQRSPRSPGLGSCSSASLPRPGRQPMTRGLQPCEQVRGAGRQDTDLGREAGHGGGRDPVLRADAPGAVVGRAGRGAGGAAAGRVCGGRRACGPCSGCPPPPSSETTLSASPRTLPAARTAQGQDARPRPQD